MSCGKLVTPQCQIVGENASSGVFRQATTVSSGSPRRRHVATLVALSLPGEELRRANPRAANPGAAGVAGRPCPRRRAGQAL